MVSRFSKTEKLSRYGSRRLSSFQTSLTVKTTKTARRKNLDKVSKHAHKLILTGTPFLNRLEVSAHAVFQ
jgi:hypothetical protein